MGILRTDRITGLGGANAIKGSAHFHGGGDCGGLETEVSSDFQFGSSNFTIEVWANWSGHDSSGFATIVKSGNTNASNSMFQFDYKSSESKLRLIPYVSNSSVVKQVSFTPIFDRWYHLAAVRDGNNIKIFIDGTQTGGDLSFSDTIDTETTGLSIGKRAMGDEGNGFERNFNGYLSNLRIVNGTAIYTSDFTPPTNELEKTSDTVLLALQSPGNLFQEATGKKIYIAGDRADQQSVTPSRKTPNSPVGFSTTTDVGSQYGTTFDGFGSFATSTYMVPPGGNTRERNRGRALLGGGHNGSSHTNHIHQLSIQSQGNTEEFGDLTNARWIPAPSSSSTRGVWSGGGGYNPGSPTGDYVNFIDFVTIATPTNATDFGDQTAEKGYHAGLSNETRGIIAGGYNDSVGKIDVIEFITIATAGNAQDFGDLTAARMQLAAAGSPTRGLFFGGAGNPNVLVDVIDYVTIATTGNATDFGDMTAVTKYGNATSSNTRAIYAGGLSPNDTTYVNVIQFVTIASTGNATDFGDLTTARSTTPGATSNNIRGIFAGGYAPGNLNSIDFVTIATAGNASNFGDISFGLNMRGIGALSDSHGGLS